MDPEFDLRLAERLLDGRLDAADAPAELSDVARLVTALRLPATDEELAGQDATVAAMVDAIGAPAPTAARRAIGTRRLRRGQVATLIAAGTLLAGTGLAAADSLPAPAQKAAHTVLGKVGVPVPGRGHSATTTGVGPSGSNGTGPQLPGPALQGLCTAAAHGEGSVNGKRDDTPAFTNLESAAADCPTTTTSATPDSEHPNNGTNRHEGEPPTSHSDHTVPTVSQGDDHQFGPPSSTPAETRSSQSGDGFSHS